MTTTIPTVTTSDVNHAAWLAAHLKFAGARVDAEERVGFEFEDPGHVGRALIGEYETDERLRSFGVWRGRFLFAIRYLRESGKSVMTAEQFTALRGRR